MLSILYVIPRLLTVFFYLAVLLVLATRPSDGSKAKRYAILGTTILLFGSVSGWAAHFVINNLIDSSALAVAYALLGILQSVLFFAGMSLVLLAVVTGRKPAVANAAADFPGEGRSNQASDNPYVSPGGR